MGNNYPTPTFKLIQAKNSNGLPVVSVTFLDGFEDTLVLSKYYGSDEAEERGIHSKANRFLIN